jgi:CarD family transcriptional regulator
MVGCRKMVGHPLEQREGRMQFSVGDKVVHPSHGPGQVTGVEQKEFIDGKRTYYVLEILDRDLTVYVPKSAADQIGMRPAMSQARLGRVLDALRGRPRLLPEDYKERQETIWEKLKTGRSMQIAEVVRDLTWHGRLDHLTRRDADLLARGKTRLAAEMALVSGTEVAEADRTIESTLAAAVSNA